MLIDRNFALGTSRQVHDNILKLARRNLLYTLRTHSCALSARYAPAIEGAVNGIVLVGVELCSMQRSFYTVRSKFSYVD